MTQKSRLTSSSEKGMYWLASDSTCTSSSSSRRPAGKMIFLVITEDCGMAITTSRVLVPLLAMTRRTASATSSNFSICPSAIQPFSKLSDANRSRTYLPDSSCPNSTSLTLDELISSPIIEGCVRPSRVSIKLTGLVLQAATRRDELLRIHFNVSSKAYVQQRKKGHITPQFSCGRHMLFKLSYRYLGISPESFVQLWRNKKHPRKLPATRFL